MQYMKNRMMSAMLVLSLLGAMLPADTFFASETTNDTQNAVISAKEFSNRSVLTVSATPGCGVAELQQLMDLNRDGNYDLVIEIPSGEYQLTKPLYVYSHTTIRAAKDAKLVKQSRYGSMLENKLVNDTGGYYQSSDITVEGGIWDSTPIMNRTSGTENFRFIHCNNITIRDAVFSNVPEKSHQITLAGVKDVLIDRCEFYGYGKDYSKAVKAKEAIQLDVVHNAELVPSAQKLCYDDLATENVTVTNCYFHEFSRGVGSHSAVAGVYHENVRIENNEFKHMSDNAIRMYNFHNSVVRNNKFYSVREGIVVYSYMTNSNDAYFFDPLDGSHPEPIQDYDILIQNNTISSTWDDTGTWGDGIRLIGCADRPLGGIRIIGNHMDNTTRYGIFATRAPGVKVASNSIDFVEKRAIRLDYCDGAVVYDNAVCQSKNHMISLNYSDDSSVYANKLEVSDACGIFVSNSKNCDIGTVGKKGNSIKTTKDCAIYVYGKKVSCDNVSVLNNEISGSRGTAAIEVERALNASVEGNTLSSSRSGIYLHNYTNDAVVAENTVTRAGKHGIYVTATCTGTSIEENTVSAYGASEAYTYGICVKSKADADPAQAAHIRKNVVKGTSNGVSRHGILADTVPGVKITGNQVERSRGYGVCVRSSDGALIQANRVHASYAEGIEAESGENIQIKGNAVSETQGSGVCALTCPEVEVTDNQISKSAGPGIYVNACADSWIQSNEIRNSKSFGVQVTASPNNQFLENTIVQSKNYGLYYTYAAGGRISENEVIEGSRAGLYVAGGCDDLWVTKNVVRNPKGASLFVHASARVTVGGNRFTTLKNYKGIFFQKSEFATLNHNTIVGPKKGSAIVMQNPSQYNALDNQVTFANGDQVVVNRVIPPLPEEEEKNEAVSGNAVSGNTVP